MSGTTTSRLVWGFITAVALLAVCAQPAGAQWRGRGGGWDGGLMLGVPLRALNLTADQQAQVQSILSSHRTSTRPIVQQLMQAQNALTDTLLASPSADVSSQLAVISGLRSQLLQGRAQATAQVLGVLTPDQRTQAVQIKAQMTQLRTQMRQLVAPTPQP